MNCSILSRDTGTTMSSTPSQADLNNHANQLNPNSSAYQAAQNNHANQSNPNSSAYNSSRGK